MSTNMLPFYLLAVAAIFTIIIKAPHSWKAAIGGAMILILLADSVIAGLRALFQ